MPENKFDIEVEKALDELRRGGVILYPTDTIWGIGCDATNEQAVERIYQIKQRNQSKSMILLVAAEKDILQYVAAPDPGVFDFIEEQERPTTIIFEHAIGLPENVVAADGSVAIRMVRDEFCRHLIKRLRKPLVSTSANISSQPAPKNFSEISEEIKNSVDHVVQWRQEERSETPPSRIIKWSNGKPEVIRE